MVTSIVHWKEPSELGLFDRPVVCVTQNNKIITFKTQHANKSTWDWHVEKYHVKYWAFLSEIMPFE